jgi:hypothetical protein
MAVFRKPISIDEMNQVESLIKTRYSDTEDTVCDHVREIYRLSRIGVSDIDVRNIIQSECKTVMVYAKRMDKALKKFHKGDYSL